MRRPKWEIFQGEDKQWYFRLKSSNGQVLAVSEGYVSASNARRGVYTARFASLWSKIVQLYLS